MKKTVIIIVVITLAFGGLLYAKKHHAPKVPPPNTQEIWADQGIPVQTDKIVRGDMERTVEVTGDINALGKVTLSAKIAGRVSGVFAREGDAIPKGMTVVQLDAQDAFSNLQQAQAAWESAVARLSQARTNLKVTDIQSDAAIAQAQAQLRAAQAKLVTVKKPARTQEELVAENSVASAKASLDNAESNRKRNQKLLDEGAISASQFDSIDSAYKVSKAQYKSAEDQLSLIKEGGRTEDIHQAQAQVAVARESVRSAKANAANSLLRREDIKAATAALQQAQAAVAMAKQQLSYTYVKSPIFGHLATRTVDPGVVVSPGQALGDVVDLNSLYFKGDVSETQLIEVVKGQNVSVQIDAMPNQVFSGTVDEIYPAGSMVSRNFSVRIGIRGGGGKIRPAMFARGNIITGTDKNVLMVPKEAVQEIHGTKIVYTIQTQAKTGKKTVISVAKRHAIEVVRENKNFVEISPSTDLNEGDAVITEGRQNLQDGLKISLGKGK